MSDVNAFGCRPVADPVPPPVRCLPGLASDHVKGSIACEGPSNQRVVVEQSWAFQHRSKILRLAHACLRMTVSLGIELQSWSEHDPTLIESATWQQSGCRRKSLLQLGRLLVVLTHALP